MRSGKKKPPRKGAGRQSRNARSDRPKHQNRQAAEPFGGLVIYGLHSARAALENPERVVKRVAITKRNEDKLETALRARADIVEKTGGECMILPATAREISASLEDGAVHQGILLNVEGLANATADAVFAELRQQDNALVVVLDQVTDPHNVGAIVRSCAVFGADAIVMTERNSPAPETVLAKAASGGLEHVPLLRVTNLARAMESLKEAGFFCIGLDGDATQDLDATQSGRHVALALGAEEKGLRRLTRENCDVLAKISNHGPLRSLNVSNAAAVALSAIRRSISS